MTQTFKDDVLTITRAYVRGGEVTSTPCFVCRIERVGGGKLRFKVEENKSKSVKWKGVTFSDGEELSFSFVQGKSLFPPDPPDKQHSVTITENKSKAQLDVSYVLTETDKDGGLGSLAGRIRFLDAKGKIADANVTEKGMMLVGNIPIKDQPLKEKFYELFVGKGLKERILEGQTAYIRDKKLKDEAQKLLSKLKPERKIWQQLISSDKGYDGMEIKDIKSILKKLKMTKLLGNIDQLKATSGKYTPSRAVEPPGKTDPDKLTKMAFQTAFEREFKTLKDKVNAYLKSIPTSSDDFLKKWEEMSKKGCSGYRYGEIRTMLNCLLTATISPEDGKPMDGELVELNKKFKELENLHKPGDRYVFVKGEESPEKRLRKNGVRAQIILKKDGKTLLKEIKKVEVK
jgi:ribosomal protein L18